MLHERGSGHLEDGRVALASMPLPGRDTALRTGETSPRRGQITTKDRRSSALDFVDQMPGHMPSRAK